VVVIVVVVEAIVVAVFDAIAIVFVNLLLKPKNNILSFGTSLRSCRFFDYLLLTSPFIKIKIKVFLEKNDMVSI
jgi:hypothetical protein